MIIQNPADTTSKFFSTSMSWNSNDAESGASSQSEHFKITHGRTPM